MHIMNIIELAKKLNLSITTVSRALGGYSDVSEVTRKRVMDFAEKRQPTRFSRERTEKPYYVSDSDMLCSALVPGLVC